MHAPANGEQSNPTPEANITAGNEERDSTMLYQCSTNNTPGTVEPDNGKCKREDSIPHIQTPSSDDISSPAKFDSNESRAFWKSPMRAREKGSKKVSMKMTQDPSPEVQVVEVYAARGFQRYVVYKRKHKTKPPTSASDDSDSDSSIQGSWNKFLVKMCFPYGRNYEDA